VKPAQILGYEGTPRGIAAPTRKVLTIYSRWITVVSIEIWVSSIVSDTVFVKAYTHVRGRYTNRTWQNLSAREITDEIYREIQQIDLQFSGVEEKAVVEPMRLAAE
jgi:hypothetical protein